MANTAGHAQGEKGRAIVQSAEGVCCRIFWPMRRAQTLYSPAFLVDEDRRILALHGHAELADQFLDLFWIIAVALEQDQSPRLVPREKTDLLCRNFRPSAAGDEGLYLQLLIGSSGWLLPVYNTISLTRCKQR